jgi:hypothetical protein|nr:MAG TPA: hypothetical protein [Caudoviricetes sp.]DAO87507.1 MAG TPA: hypothetical protein [Caudoviricetes sp.]DAU00417.1 MAG TPA: hypothetical protein [Caudoviricetes sp.]
MAYQETSKTAWDGLSFLVGECNATDISKMPASGLNVFGYIKQGSFSMSTEAGEKKEWKDVNGELVDSHQGEGKLTISFHVKNFNKGVMEKIFDVTENADKLEVKSFSTSKEIALKIDTKVSGAEVLEIPRAKISGEVKFEEGAGYGVDITVTVLPTKVGAPKLYISKKA